MTTTLWTGLVVLGFVLLMVFVLGELMSWRRSRRHVEPEGAALEDQEHTVVHEDDVDLRHRP